MNSRPKIGDTCASFPSSVSGQQQQLKISSENFGSVPTTHQVAFPKHHRTAAAALNKLDTSAARLKVPCISTRQTPLHDAYPSSSSSSSAAAPTSCSTASSFSSSSHASFPLVSASAFNSYPTPAISSAASISSFRNMPSLSNSPPVHLRSGVVSAVNSPALNATHPPFPSQQTNQTADRLYLSPVTPLTTSAPPSPYQHNAVYYSFSGSSTPLSATPSKRRRNSLADYHFIARLGRGAMGEVQLARHKITGKLFAIKILSKSRVLQTKELEHTRCERDILADIAELSRKMRRTPGASLPQTCLGPPTRQFGGSSFIDDAAPNSLANTNAVLSPTDSDSPLSYHNANTKAESTSVASSGTSSIWTWPRQPCPFLIHMKCAFQTDTHLFLVLDYHPGGDMATLLERKAKMTEEEARFYTAEILLGLRDLHDLGVVYRDLKPENVLLGPEGHIVLTDFGLSKQFGLNTEGIGASGHTSTFCGTAEYLAPEVLLHKPYSYEVDWWSLGTFLYEMIVGVAPFWDENHHTMYEKVLSGDLEFPRDVSEDAKSLISGLLIRDPEKRLGAGLRKALDIMEHPFFRSINWEDVFNLRLVPPYKPKLKSEYDVSNFDPEFTSDPPMQTPMLGQSIPGYHDTEDVTRSCSDHTPFLATMSSPRAVQQRSGKLCGSSGLNIVSTDSLGSDTGMNRRLWDSASSDHSSIEDDFHFGSFAVEVNSVGTGAKLVRKDGAKGSGSEVSTSSEASPRGIQVNKSSLLRPFSSPKIDRGLNTGLNHHAITEEEDECDDAPAEVRSKSPWTCPKPNEFGLGPVGEMEDEEDDFYGVAPPRPTGRVSRNGADDELIFRGFSYEASDFEMLREMHFKSQERSNEAPTAARSKSPTGSELSVDSRSSPRVLTSPGLLSSPGLLTRNLSPIGRMGSGGTATSALRLQQLVLDEEDVDTSHQAKNCTDTNHHLARISEDADESSDNDDIRDDDDDSDDDDDYEDDDEHEDWEAFKKKVMSHAPPKATTLPPLVNKPTPPPPLVASMVCSRNNESHLKRANALQMLSDLNNGGEKAAVPLWGGIVG